MDKQKLVLGIIFLVSLVVVIIVPVIIVSTSKKSSTDAPTSTVMSSVTKKPYNPDQLSDEEKSRINCFLEEQSQFEILTEYQCVTVRGCIYKPSQFDKVFFIFVSNF